MCSQAARQITVNLIPQLRKAGHLMPMYLTSGDPEITCDDCGSNEFVYEWITINGDALSSRPWQCGCCIMKAYYGNPSEFEIVSLPDLLVDNR